MSLHSNRPGGQPQAFGCGFHGFFVPGLTLPNGKGRPKRAANGILGVAELHHHFKP
jgi:hypothetical protein